MVMLLLHIPGMILRERHALTLRSKGLIMILVCWVSSSFEVRHFMIVMSLVPKDVRLLSHSKEMIKKANH